MRDGQLMYGNIYVQTGMVVSCVCSFDGINISVTPSSHHRDAYCIMENTNFVAAKVKASVASYREGWRIG